MVELERMRAQHGILRRDTSPSRLDKFIKTLEEERDYYKFEVEYLQDLVSGRNSPICSPRRGRSPTRITPVKVSNCIIDIGDSVGYNLKKAKITWM